MTRRTAIQPDLFAAEEHRAKLDRLGDPLQEMEAVIDFAALVAEVEKIALLEDQPKGGRPPYPIETMVRIVVLKRLYGLSDEQMEYQLLDVFTAIEAMGGKMIRTIRQERADFALTLMAACYALRRTVWLVKSGAIPW